MFGTPIPATGPTGLPRTLYVPVGAAMAAVMLALSLSPLTDAFVARLLLFYLGTTLAYGLMPYVRRGDIPLVAAWVVLLAELAPCVAGQLISPVKVTADVLGVLMAAGPIYVARLRQIQQGDVRPGGRRASENG
ncbi:MAG: hypothetical protein KKE02_19995 [Alphaproteobacteria bacterium]|nr:hypothetical protein [Alphaproteobacteria bacterium]MBU1514755.1 hypothetical protein [Alphaproteobacteria bacterium]MBU2093886.1 hypothetical protein [Alphaproteobacteria bacterium]MBU2153313.1 hypothetical protein [Alphaproteobacteria bacterium]MBU2309741.1 hypothetical protein [Alphaproteobacteria bacterium]